MSDLSPFARRRYPLALCALRPLRTGDAPALAQALAAMDPWLTFGYPADRFVRYLCRRDPALQRYAIMNKRKLAGVAAVRYPWLHGAYLELLGILPAFQGRGLGAEVMQWFEDRSFSAAPHAWVLVSSFNARGRKFYARRGFRELAVLPDFLKPGHDEILLHKPR